MEGAVSWLTQLGDPLRPTPEEAASFMAAELERAAPPGWKVTRQTRQGPGLGWVIVKVDVQPGEWPVQEYGVWLTADLKHVIFTHGNNDAGVLGLHHFLHNAMIIPAAALRHFGMSACLKHVLSHCKPNEWGYT